VTSQNIHHDGERRDMGGHDEDQNYKLTKSKEFATPWAKDNHTGIGHAVNLGIPDFELPDHESRVAS
jgi:hypothetical protein